MQMFIWKITDNHDILTKYDIWIFLLIKINEGCMHDTTSKDLMIYMILVKVRMLQRLSIVEANITELEQ